MASFEDTEEVDENTSERRRISYEDIKHYRKNDHTLADLTNFAINQYAITDLTRNRLDYLMTQLYCSIVYKTHLSVCPAICIVMHRDICGYFANISMSASYGCT